MGTVVWGTDFKAKQQASLYEIGMAIIRSAEFQADIANSPKQPGSFDPIAVAIMSGHYTAPDQDPA